MKQRLNSLPINLVDTYRRTLSQINDCGFDDVRTTLSWLCFSARPLSLEEIGGVLEVDLNGLSMDSDRRYVDLKVILSRCTSLVHQESPDDVGKNKLRLAHYSVKEYLLSGGDDRFSITEDDTQLNMAKSCLIYLLHMPPSHSEENHVKYPFASYAAEHWMDHARSQGDADAVGLRQLIIKLLNPSQPHFTIWTRLLTDQYFQGVPRPSAADHHPLYYTSLKGLAATTSMLLEGDGADIQAAPSQHYGSALVAASWNGHDAVVRLLLVHIASPIQSSGHDHPLRIASWNGHETIVYLLLEHGANPNQPDSYGFPLQAASWKGHEGVASLLLEHGANPNELSYHGYPLQVASFKGHDAIVRLLLEHGANPNEHAYGRRWGRRPLLGTSQNDHAAVVQLSCKDHTPPVQIASYVGYNDTVRVLKHGADPNLCSRGIASSNGREPVVLEHGADPNQSNETISSSPLQTASWNGHEAVVRLLLEYKADPNRPGGRGYPLQAASWNGHEAVVRLLLEHGADPDQQSKGVYSFIVLQSERYVDTMIIQRYQSTRSCVALWTRSCRTSAARV